MGDLAVAPPRDARWRLKVQVNERGFDPLPLAEKRRADRLSVIHR